jgi:arginase family enzyme
MTGDHAAICSFDGTSRTSGAGEGAEELWKEYFAGSTRVEPRRFRLESKNSAMFCRQLHDAATHLGFRLALGGEHLITFPLVEALAARQPDLKLVVLDAHHDAYDYPLLTHYSLFHFTVHDLGVPTMIVAARHELDQASAGVRVLSAHDLAAQGIHGALSSIASFIGDSPFYLSVDLDVLEPSVFPAVSAPVDGGLSVDELSTLIRGLLARDPVAVDITEYNPVSRRRAPGELGTLEPVFAEVHRWL